jgi:hypothetical protein
MGSRSQPQGIRNRVAIRSRDMGDTSGKEVCLALEGDVTRDGAETIHRRVLGAGGSARCRPGTRTS